MKKLYGRCADIIWLRDHLLEITVWFTANLKVDFSQIHFQIFCRVHMKTPSELKNNDFHQLLIQFSDIVS